MTRFIIAVVPLLLVPMFLGCSNGDNPVAEEGMKLDDANLFPFAAGQHFVFSGYESVLVGKNF
jgi:hypothetical protein